MFEEVSSDELARLWLSHFEDDSEIGEEIRVYCWNLGSDRGRFLDWFRSLSRLAVSDDEISLIAAGPAEYALEEDGEFPDWLETNIDKDTLVRILVGVWYDNVPPRTREWAEIVCQRRFGR